MTPPTEHRAPHGGGKPRAKRDPVARRQAIAEAAAHLIAHEGTRRLTHRRVAERAGVPLGSTTQYFESIDDLRRCGLVELRRMIELDYDGMFEKVAENGGGPEAFAAAFNEFFADAERVEADAAFYASAVNDPEVRELAREAFEASARRCAPYMGAFEASLLAALLHGLTVDTHLHGAPVDPAAVEQGVRAIMSSNGDGGRPRS